LIELGLPKFRTTKSSIDSYLTKMEKNVLEKEEEKNKMVLQHKTNTTISKKSSLYKDYLIISHP